MLLRLTFSLIAGILFYLIIILMLIKKNKLNLKYTLLWLFSAVVMVILVAVPQVSIAMAELIGVEMPSNAVFVTEGLFALLIILSLTSIASTQTLRIRRLTQTQAVLEKRVREVESQIEQLLKDK